MLLPWAYLACHALVLLLSPAHAELLSFAFLTGAPLLAAGVCLWRGRGNGAAPAWIALAVGLLLWAGGMAVNMVQTVWMNSPDATAGASILLYVLYGVPLTFALASPERERWQVRVVDAVLALVLGYLFFVHTFSFATMSTTSHSDVGKLVLMLDIENAFIALFSLVRWQASRTAARRGFYRCQTAFAWAYLAAAAYINHVEPADAGFGGYSDLLIDLPFLLLASLALRAPTTVPPARVSRRLSLVVQVGSPLLLPMSLLVMSALISGTHLHLAIAGFVIATLGYGVRSVITQLRAMAERDQLDALARVDQLTGLANRREFDDALLREWNRARRSGEPLALLLVDIDHFKRLNDAFGHQVGDTRLREVARSLAGGTTRALDVVARYGGEEFAVILPATHTGAAQMLAEHMRAAVQALHLQAPAPEGHITISIGVSAAEHVVSDDPADLLAATDAALYDAKRAGRNRVAYRALGDR